MKNGQKKKGETEVSCYIALKATKPDEHLTDIRTRQGQHGLPLHSQKMREAKSLAQGNAPRKGQEGTAKNSNSPGQPVAAWQMKQGMRN